MYVWLLLIRKKLPQTIELLGLVWNTLNYTTVCKVLVLERNTLKHITVRYKRRKKILCYTDWRENSYVRAG